MDQSGCQALCVMGCEVSGHLGAIIALTATTLASTMVATVGGLKRRRERARERERVREAERVAVDAERVALEERTRAELAAKDAAFWREQSMRPGALAPGRMPREAVELQLQSLPVPSASSPPRASNEAEEAARAGTRWVDFEARGRSSAPTRSELEREHPYGDPRGRFKLPSDSPAPDEQFADEPTDPGKRKGP